MVFFFLSNTQRHLWPLSKQYVCFNWLEKFITNRTKCIFHPIVDQIGSDQVIDDKHKVRLHILFFFRSKFLSFFLLKFLFYFACLVDVNFFLHLSSKQIESQNFNPYKWTELTVVRDLTSITNFSFRIMYKFSHSRVYHSDICLRQNDNYWISFGKIFRVLYCGYHM